MSGVPSRQVVPARRMAAGQRTMNGMPNDLSYRSTCPTVVTAHHVAVVGREHHDGVVRLTDRLEAGEQPRELVVDAVHRGKVLLHRPLRLPGDLV